MAIERFEDIEAWKAARELMRKLYADTSEGAFGKDYGLRDQIRRASVSIMGNIAEGFDGQSNKAFIQFLGYALRSATEVQSHLYVALDQGYITQDKFDNLYQQAVKVQNLTHGFTPWNTASLIPWGECAIFATSNVVLRT